MNENPTQKTNRFANRKNVDILTVTDTMGRKPPSVIDLEQAVLGALLLDGESLLRVQEILRPDYFFDEKNKYVFQAIQSLFERNQPIDLLTVTEKLRTQEKLNFVGGEFYISELTMKVTSSANIEYYSSVIYEMFIKREIIKLCYLKINNMYQEDIDTFLEIQELSNDLDNLTTVGRKDFKEFSSIVKSNLENIKEIQKKGLNITGIDTGYKKMNNVLCGWQNTDLIIIGARPATGKTAFALNLAEKVATQGIPVALFSLEMSDNQLADRLVSKLTTVPAFKLKSASLNSEEWSKLNYFNYEIPLFIDDTPSLNILDFKARARRAHKQHGIKMIFVDYLQLMTTYLKANRDQQIGEISRGLKAIAKELKIPVVALSQLSRDIEKSKRMPLLSDLRESGNIEQDADIIMFLHDNGDPTDSIGDISVVLAKHRAGSLGIIPFDFFKKSQSFSEKITEMANSYQTPF